MRKENKENFEIDEIFRISNSLRINSEKMPVDSLNLLIAKKSMKENKKTKERLYIKRGYWKEQIITNEGKIAK